jgi:GntR family transcriptional regulator
MQPRVSTPVASPAYLRIATALRDRINSGELAPNTLVPSERELGRSFGVSRMTARQALGVLESDGFAHRRPPRGTFVAKPRLPMRIGSFSDEIVRLGRQPSGELLWAESQASTPLVAQALELGEGDRVHALQRLRRVDDEAIAIETTYYPADLTQGLLDRQLDGSLWSILRRDHGVTPTRASATLEVVALDEVTAGQLGVRNAAPGFLLTRHTFDADGRCFEFARDLYRADRVEFQIEAPISLPPLPPSFRPSTTGR